MANKNEATNTVANVVSSSTTDLMSLIASMTTEQLKAFTENAKAEEKLRKEKEANERKARQEAERLLKEKEKAQEALIFVHPESILEVNVRLRNEKLLGEKSKWMLLKQDAKNELIEKIYSLVNSYFIGIASKVDLPD